MDAKGAPLNGSVKRRGSHRTSARAEKLLEFVISSGCCTSRVCDDRKADFDPLYDGRAYIANS
jgi:hypothetical protein